MTEDISHGEIRASIARLEVALTLHTKGINVRLAALEETQKDLVSIATKGKTALSVLLWIGGLLAGTAAAAAAFWKK